MLKKVLITGLSSNIGGIETAILNLISHIDPEKIKFDFLFTTKSECVYKEEILKKQGDLIYISSFGENPFKYKKSLEALFNEKEYDLIWINSSNRSDIILHKTVKKYTNSKIIVHSHGTSFEVTSKLKYLMVRMLHSINKNSYINNTDYFFACSLEAGKWLFDSQVIQGEKFRVINNPIDLEKFEINSKKRQILRNQYEVSEKCVLLHVGRLVKIKNQKFLLEVFKDFQKYRPDSELFIAGDGDLKEELITYARELGVLNKVRFLGTRSDIPDLMQMADLFILPSFSEGLGVVLLEAQAMGLPCYASDTVPKESQVSKLIEYISLKEDSKYWATRMLDSEKIQEVKDIEDEIKYLDIISTSNDFGEILLELD